MPDNTPSPQDSVDDEYQKIQRIYLDWHDGRRPLSGFIKAIENYRDAAIRNVLVELDGEIPEKRDIPIMQKGVPHDMPTQTLITNIQASNHVIAQVHQSIQKRLKDE